jgi:ribosomal protein L34
LNAGTISNKCYGNILTVYEKLSEIINDSSRVISMDGDYGNRSHFFLASFNMPVRVIENTIKFNKKKFEVFKDDTEFDSKISTTLDINKNIVIVCMSAEVAIAYSQKLTEAYPDKKIKVYTSKTDDIDKKDVININKKWLVDILIYSPAIESGVDFNIEHFDNLFIIYSQLSTCTRGLNQMMNRVRKFKDDNVCVLFKKVPHNANACYTLDEITTNYMATSRKDEITVADMIYCYNLEEKQRSDKNFYGDFIRMITNKGHSILSARKNKAAKDVPKHNIISKDELMEAKNIDVDQYNELLKKQKNNCATREEKYEIEKYIYMSKFGLTEMTEEFLEAYYKKIEIFDNHLGIIDIRNVKNYEFKNGIDYETQKRIKLCECAHNIINTLGFENCYDNKQIDGTTIEKTIPFVNEYYNLMMLKKQLKDTNKSHIGGINNVLNQYGLYLKSSDNIVKVNKKVIHSSSYSLKPKNDIDVYVSGRVNNGLKIKDTNKLIKIICLVD